VGGRSGVAWTLELRHPIRGAFAGVVFLDAGQVALDSYDFPFDDLRYGSGFGVRYNSPVGPISLDLGFAAQPPGDDQIWQIHVSLGSIF
jgi:outer membrane translocation and assembly module TamA